MSQQTGARPHETELARELSLFDTINLVIGTIIGSGIFLVPSEIARAVWTPGWMLGVWVIGGVLTMLGALSLAELGAAMPHAGGIYTFITRAFGRLWGFLCGWMLFTVATSGSIATLGAAFPIYLGAFVPLNPTTTKVAGVLAIVVLTWINIIGVKNGARVGNVLTALKVGGLVIMIAVIFVLPGPTKEAAAASAAAAPALPSGAAPVAAIGVALVAVLWAYEGWHDVSFAAGELRDPQKNFPRAAIGGVVIVIVLYLSANLAYLSVLSPAEIAATDRVALLAMTRVTGEWGGKLMTAAILCSMLGAMNALILAGPRAYYQMAKDRLFFERVVARPSPLAHARRGAGVPGPLVHVPRSLHRRVLPALHVRDLRRLDLLCARRPVGHRPAAQGAEAGAALPRSGLSVRPDPLRPDGLRDRPQHADRDAA